jgi:hypothetical protein
VLVTRTHSRLSSPLKLLAMRCTVSLPGTAGAPPSASSPQPPQPASGACAAAAGAAGAAGRAAGCGAVAPASGPTGTACGAASHAPHAPHAQPLTSAHVAQRNEQVIQEHCRQGQGEQLVLRHCPAWHRQPWSCTGRPTLAHNCAAEAAEGQLATEAAHACCTNLPPRVNLPAAQMQACGHTWAQAPRPLSGPNQKKVAWVQRMCML